MLSRLMSKYKSPGSLPPRVKVMQFLFKMCQPGRKFDLGLLATKEFPTQKELETMQTAYSDITTVGAEETFTIDRLFALIFGEQPEKKTHPLSSQKVMTLPNQMATMSSKPNLPVAVHATKVVALALALAMCSPPAPPSHFHISRVLVLSLATCWDRKRRREPSAPIDSDVRPSVRPSSGTGSRWAA